eukprot:scaffold63199_cov35-Cyclotella_meneghiniana.AAC.1
MGGVIFFSRPTRTPKFLACTTLAIQFLAWRRVSKTGCGPLIWGSKWRLEPPLRANFVSENCVRLCVFVSANRLDSHSRQAAGAPFLACDCSRRQAEGAEAVADRQSSAPRNDCLTTVEF